MSKEKYYSSKKLRKVNCNYYIIIGQKSNGKSFDIKSLLLKEALEEGRNFAYMRRWSHDRTANKVEKYFSDEELFTVNDFKPYTEVQCYTDNIYLGTRDDKGKQTRDKLVGYSVALSSETHHASLAYPNVYNILFEEFITDSGYLGQEEVTIFNRLASTILRRRPDTHIYMIGNTINRFCPYFSEFNININEIKKGEIVYITYHDPVEDKDIKIGLEYCDDIFSNPLVFGKSARMINGGEWQVNHVPLVRRDTRADQLIFKFYVKKEHSIYKCLVLYAEDERQPYIFVYPFTGKESNITKNDRYFTDTVEMQQLLHNKYLTNLLKCDILITELFKLDRICYSDSLTGTEFEIIRNERRWR